MGPDEPSVRILTDLLAKLDLDAEARGKLAAEVLEYRGRDLRERAFLTLIAVDLDHFYTSVESTLEAIARALDGAVPKGADWHRALLAQLAAAGPTRPAVLEPDTKSRLEPLLRFRSFLRHAYAIDLDWAKMEPLVATLPAAALAIGSDLDRFRAFVQRCLAVDDDPPAG